MTRRVIPSQKLPDLACEDAAVQRFVNGELRKYVSEVYEQFRGLEDARVIRLKGYTVTTLPTGTIGDTAYVTDALAPVFGAAVAGGGAVMVPVYYTGAAWFVG